MDHVRLSKTMAHALRHAPADYGLTLDQDGWVNLRDLTDGILRKTSIKPYPSDFDAVLRLPGKRRYEIAGERIRAFNGHSVETKIQQKQVVPPELLFHGTVMDALGAIKATGLKPMSRQYVHMSADRATAITVGNRRRSDTVVLQILAMDAHAEGVKFYEGVDGIWMADEVPVKFIRVLP